MTHNADSGAPRCCAETYICPGTGEAECLHHGGFDNCCGHPDCPGNVDATYRIPPVQEDQCNS